MDVQVDLVVYLFQVSEVPPNCADSRRLLVLKIPTKRSMQKSPWRLASVTGLGVDN